MPQPHKGERQYVPARVPAALGIDQLYKAAGYADRGQYISDVLCKNAGREDLVVGPPSVREEDSLPLPLTA